MSYQTEEQQVEQLKEWWNDNGTPLIVGAALGLSGFFGWKYWNEEQILAQTRASDSFLTVSKALDSDNSEEISSSSQTVKAEFPESSYAVLSAFQLAKQAVKDNQLDIAVTELNWVLTNHANSELAAIAKIRIARVLIAQDKAEKALEYLDFAKNSGFTEMANLVKGDAFLSLGKETEALEAYQAASNVGKVTANHPTIKMRIASLQVPAFDISDTTDKSLMESDAVDTDNNESENNSSESESSDTSNIEKTDGESE